MFEVTEQDIANLNDTDLRTLVARLAVAELRAQACPTSSVSAGGNQDAADNGIDVWVDCPTSLPNPNFVPRRRTVFQVKKPDMPAGEICKEMRPRGVLRPVILNLAATSGAYIIVSAQGSVAATSLKKRRQAMRDQLKDLPDANELYTEFYDRNKLAIWVSHYPGIAAWVLSRFNIKVSGWNSIDECNSVVVRRPVAYLMNDAASIIDERTGKRERLTLGEGVSKLREVLAQPGQCVRLIGLSGLGKTRLVQALFEDAVGDVPLDPSIAVYTDYSKEPCPRVCEMARWLVQENQHAILIVDNCNPAVHSDLAQICTASGSKVSLITVEYDVRDDLPEHTEVFRLQPASPDLVSLWLEETFPDLMQGDLRTITNFSGGNFRIALALAQTIKQGETLDNLKTQDLFMRLFQQRNAHDQDLFRAAGELALLYSIDGEDAAAGSELAHLATIRDVSSGVLYETLMTLRQRAIVQQRGRWHAVLPHAIANWLAASALERIPATAFERFYASLTPRMRKSLSRRLGYLHDSASARSVIERWLRPGGPLGNLAAIDETRLQMLSNIAPVDPTGVLRKIKDEINGEAARTILDPTSHIRGRWIRLIKQLAYDADLFDDAAWLLARFLAAEPPGHEHDSAKSDFARLFRLRYSETQASPEQRRALILEFARSSDHRFRRCASVALVSMLDTQTSLRFNKFDFGAHSRDWGWMPLSEDNAKDDDACAWYISAVELVGELAPMVSSVRDDLASHVRNLWCIPACQNALERIATQLSAQFLWIEGWGELRRLLRSSSRWMPEDGRARLRALVERLEPKECIHEAYAFLFTEAGHLDASNNAHDKSGESLKEKATRIGITLARDQEMRAIFIDKMLTSTHASYAWQIGNGIAAGATDLSIMWQELTGRYNSMKLNTHVITLLCGFIHGSQARDARFTDDVLEALLVNSELTPALPRLQAAAGIDTGGIARLRRAIRQGILSTCDLWGIAHPGVAVTLPAALGGLLSDIAEVPDGEKCALFILNSHLKRDQNDQRLLSPESIELGRSLLCRTDLVFVDYLIKLGMPSRLETRAGEKAHNIIHICCSETGGEAALRNICRHARRGLEKGDFSAVNVECLLKSLFDIDNFIALDEFLLSKKEPDSKPVFKHQSKFWSPIEELSPWTLLEWAFIDPERRFPILGREMDMFHWDTGRDSQITSNFRNILRHAPHKISFLGDIISRVHPHSSSGARVNLLNRRRKAIIEFGHKLGADVLQWVNEGLPSLDRWLEHELMQDRNTEQSFE